MQQLLASLCGRAFGRHHHSSHKLCFWRRLGDSGGGVDGHVGGGRHGNNHSSLVLHLIICLTIITSLPAVAATSPQNIQYIEDTFSDGTNNGNFNHLAVDRNTGRVYIGAVNRLYQLSETLVQQKMLTTGPKDDSPFCPPEGSECECSTDNCEDFIRKPTNSINKALVIDYKGGKLIACTNLFQGHCEKRHLSDISQMDDHVFKSIVPNDEISPAVVFIGPGPSKASSRSDQSQERLVLYVAATRSTQGLDLYKDLVPNLSSRDLGSFDLAAKDIARGTKIDLEYRQRSTFRVHYVDGFISGGFSYVVAIQPEKLDIQNSDYVSKIIRVCQNDRKFYSFTEVDLQCHHNGVKYNILRAIDVAHPGAHLALSLGLSHLPPLTDMEVRASTRWEPGSQWVRQGFCSLFRSMCGALSIATKHALTCALKRKA